MEENTTKGKSRKINDNKIINGDGEYDIRKIDNVMDIDVGDVPIPKNPSELKKYDYKTLSRLAIKIRQKIIGTVSKNAGHLSSNLGSVELTLALHRVFNSPDDKIIWDVGHQSYPHKLVTGRWNDFHTLRQYDGLCGYPLPSENIHDFFAVGHSSTSISASLGIALANRMKGNDKDRVIAVIGDGAITAGMAYEGLNTIGYLQIPVIVVLNENGVSISPNVGAMGDYTNRLTNKIVNSPIFKEVRKDIHLLLDNIKDEKLLDAVKRLRIRALSVLSDEIVFEELGFAYIGPVDGHDIRALEKALNDAKNFNGPIVVHVRTVKGLGYPPSAGNPTKYHSSGKFDIATGEFIKKKDTPIKWTKAFSNALVRIADKNEKVVGITAAMPDGTGMIDMMKKYPNRAFDMGIAEQNAVTASAGLATQGFIPVTAIYSTFMQRAFDQFSHDVCLQNLHVVLCLDRAGIVGDDGPTHHGNFDLSFMRIPPNAIVMAPKDENELGHMLYTAVEKVNQPIVMRYPRGPAVGVEIDDEFKEIPIGKGEIVFPIAPPGAKTREDNIDLTIITLGSMVYPSVRAAEKLKDKGLNIEVINARFAKPLDRELIIDSAKRSKRILTVEENTLIGGFGSAVLELLSQEGLTDKVYVKRLGIPDEWITWGNADMLRDQIGLSEQGIMNAAERFIKSN